MEQAWILFYLHTLDDFYKRETMQHFLDTLVSLGYSLRESSEELTTPVTAGITPRLRERVEVYLSQRGQKLALDAYNEDDPGLEFGVSFSLVKEGYFVIFLDEERFFSDEERDIYYPIWLDLLKKVYACWHPAYVQEGLKDDEGIDREISLSEEFRYLYETNIFGPGLVARIGRERLLNAPAWKVEELDDGAILLIPSQHFSVDTEANVGAVIRFLEE
ncbi:MAG TPA: hypothetical protein VFV38_12215 [Ktedonobacteraceae bacterium]|nr:hypothetical protein [Ktedonobacteraceae bacterium]